MRALAVASGCKATGVCGRGFPARLATLDDQNACAFFAELNRERESNDAPANDDYVPILHCRIVEERGELIDTTGVMLNN